MNDSSSRARIKDWFLQGSKPSAREHVYQDVWWRVMCLTGLDYFSSIGFTPGIAFLAAGLLSPIATLMLVLMTLFGAYPIYARVARESPDGLGSFLMLERLLSGWQGKTVILILLGFASTGFIITMTLCSADAAIHLIENPFCPSWARNQMAITLVLLLVLSAVFMVGFREAIGTAVVMVFSYLFLNGILLTRCVLELINHPQALSSWGQQLLATYPSVWTMLGISLLVFPKLALGLSGFETGVSVMPHVRGEPPDLLSSRVKNTRRLLMTAAVIMTVLLVTSSLVTTMLIPASLFQPGHEANGRAMAYLGHQLMGHAFGTVYDVSTIVILWFAGASTMAALLNLIPRYLPHYGMAPAWVRAHRPLVGVITVINVCVTLLFHADVDSQAPAFATGLLMLFTSAALACTLSAWRESLAARSFYTLVLLMFVYTTAVNIFTRTEGLFISCGFIALILTTSIASRAIRSTELRVSKVELDDQANTLIAEAIGEHMGVIRLLAHRPGDTDYAIKEDDARWRHSIQSPEGNFIFVEVDLHDASEFTDEVLHVTGHNYEGSNLLRCSSPAVPNALAAILLHVRDTTGRLPHVYFGWTEGHPLFYVLKYIFLGEGETAPLTREILRSAEPDERKRPLVHVG